MRSICSREGPISGPQPLNPTGSRETNDTERSPVVATAFFDLSTKVQLNLHAAGIANTGLKAGSSVMA